MVDFFMTYRSLISSVIAVGFLSLSGCTTTDHTTYVTPGKEADSATLAGSSRMESLTTFQRYRLLSMADSFYPQSAKSVVKVDPGTHRLVVAATFRNGLGTYVYDAVVAVNATFEKGGSYVINGRIEGTSVHAWVEESPSGRRVSNVGIGPGQAQVEAGAPFPVVIPAR